MSDNPAPRTTPPADPAELITWSQTPEGIAYFQRLNEELMAQTQWPADRPPRTVRVVTKPGHTESPTE